jgi:hypothetical protein
LTPWRGERREVVVLVVGRAEVVVVEVVKRARRGRREEEVSRSSIVVWTRAWMVGIGGYQVGCNGVGEWVSRNRGMRWGIALY